MNQGGPGKRGSKPSLDGDIDVAQLRRLIEIQSQVVTLAKQNELAGRRHKEMQRSLNGRRGLIRRIVRFFTELAQRNHPLDTAP